MGKDLGHSFIKAQVVECVTVTLMITQSFARIFVDKIKLILRFFQFLSLCKLSYVYHQVYVIFVKC